MYGSFVWVRRTFNSLKWHLSARPVAGNPVYEGFAAAIDDLKASGASMLVVNQCICNGATVGVFAGDPIEAPHAGIPLVTKCFAAKIAGGVVRDKSDCQFRK